MAFSVVIGGIATLVLTIIVCLKILPAKYNGTFNKKGLQTLHDYFNFKKLYLETILKILFTFLSIASFVGGISVATIGNLFSFGERILIAIRYGYSIGLRSIFEVFATFLGGVAAAFLVPLVLRLVYEGLMMFILLVKNVMDINNKIKSPENKIEEIPEEVNCIKE